MATVPPHTTSALHNEPVNTQSLAQRSVPLRSLPMTLDRSSCLLSYSVSDHIIITWCLPGHSSSEAHCVFTTVLGRKGARWLLNDLGDHRKPLYSCHFITFYSWISFFFPIVNLFFILSLVCFKFSISFSFLKKVVTCIFRPLMAFGTF